MALQVGAYAEGNDFRASTTVTAEQQQTVKVSGKVYDQDGLPVIGANVTEKGGKNGTITDFNGAFSFNVSSRNAEIEISYVGYRTQVVKVTPGKEMNITLAEDSQLMDELVVVAFGKQTRESFTGSAGVVKTDKITERQVSNPVLALNGQVAGLQMIEGNSPTSDPTIRIRGIGSINASNSPLIVVDGIPYNGYYSDINPQDVESISVLKDAASNALYGARGANGVILITTKHANLGKATITLDAKVGANTNGQIDYDRITEPGQYYEAHYAALYNYYRNAQGYDIYNSIKAANNTLGASTDKGGLGYMVYNVPQGQYLIGENGRLNPAATLGNVVNGYMLMPDDWKKEGLRTGMRQEYNVNVNGGTDQFQFYGSLGYIDNEGLAYGSDYQRYSTRVKADYQAKPWLKLGANFSYTHNESNELGGAFSAAYEVAPIYPVYVRDAQGNILTDKYGKVYDWGDGTYFGTLSAIYSDDSPLQDDRINLSNNNSNAFGVQGYADISFLKDFTLTVNAGIYDTENRTMYAMNPTYGYYKKTGGFTSTGHYRTYSLNLQQLLNWSHQYGLNNVSVMLGHEYNRDNNTGIDATKNKLYDFDTNVELNGALTKADISGSSSMYNVEGYFARAQYDYDARYFFNASFRRDGSSRFHASHRWGNFWSVGGAWLINKESWFNTSWINELKFKASFGQQGNDGIGNFRYTDVYNYTSTYGQPGYFFGSKGKLDISWETNSNFNTGLEFGFFKNRISGSIEYYNRKTTDMLMWVSVPTSTGYNGYYSNVGDMNNRGIELDLNFDIIRTQNIGWSVNMNLTHNQNEVVRLNDDNRSSHANDEGHMGYISGNYLIAEGLPMYSWYIKKYAGVDENGKSMWYYTTEDGKQATTTSWDNGSYYLCGDSNPDIYGGFGTTFNAYGFDLSVNFLYSLGGKALDYGYETLMTPPVAGTTGFAYHKDVFNSWSTENPDAVIPRWQFGDNETAFTSDRFLTSSNSLTFKNISVGYTFPKKLTQKLQLSKLRIYASCDNVYYWSKRKGFDPRSSLSGAVYGSGYAPMRTISGGINVQF